MNQHAMNMHLAANVAGLSPTAVDGQCIACTGAVIDYFNSEAQLRVLREMAGMGEATPEQIAIATGYAE